MRHFLDNKELQNCWELERRDFFCCDLGLATALSKTFCLGNPS